MADPAKHLRPYLSCDYQALFRDGESCFSDLVRDLGRSVFRRPLDQREVDALVRLGSAGETPADRLRDLVHGMLLAPQFLYRSELGEEDASGARMLTDYEKATWLSYSVIGTRLMRLYSMQLSAGSRTLAFLRKRAVSWRCRPQKIRFRSLCSTGSM